MAFEALIDSANLRAFSSVIPSQSIRLLGEIRLNDEQSGAEASGR
jgi:hypothetical protein